MGVTVWQTMPVILQRLGLIIWPAGILLEALILGRMLYQRAFKQFRVFYLYILCVFLISGILYGLYWIPGDFHVVYAKWYWQTQMLTAVAGYGVILDFALKSLADYPGADRFVRAVGLCILFCTFGLVGFHLIATGSWSVHALTSDLEKYLRIVEAVFLAATLLILSYFRIAIGRNLTGIALGMGLYVSVSLTMLALVKYVGPSFYPLWEFLQSSSYLVALIIWTVALWSYDPMPPPSRPPSSGNYAELASRTRAELESLRDYFGSGVRS
jgi:hypothetical protein